jgi:hypothetical protein
MTRDDSTPAATSAATSTSTATASRTAPIPARTRPRAATSPAARRKNAYAGYSEAGPTTSTTCSGCCASSRPPSDRWCRRRCSRRSRRPGFGSRSSTARPARRCTRPRRAGRTGNLHRRPARARLPVPERDRRLHRAHDQGLRRRAEPRRAAAHAADQRAGSIRRSWCRCCTTTARRSPRASSRGGDRRRASRASTCTTLERQGGLMTYLAKPKLHHPTLPPRTASATPAATTKARSRRSAPAAATTRSRPRSSRPAGNSTSSRTASPSCRASAARRRRPTTSSATRTASTPCTGACRRCSPAPTWPTAS